MGVGDQWTWTWLAQPSLTLQWAQCSEWSSLTPCMSSHAPQKCNIGIVKGTRESGKETIWPRRNGLYWCLSWPFRKKSRSAQLWSPHGNMWQRALKTVHTWTLHWEVALWTRTKLPLHIDQSSVEGPVSDGWGKGLLAAQCFLWP